MVKHVRFEPPSNYLAITSFVVSEELTVSWNTISQQLMAVVKPSFWSSQEKSSYIARKTILMESMKLALKNVKENAPFA